MLTIILLLLAAVFFGLAAIGTPSSRINLVAAGLFCWVLVPLIGALH